MIEYIHNNPVRRGLVARAEDWKWSSAGWFEGKNLLRPDPLDFGGTTLFVGGRGKESYERERRGAMVGPQDRVGRSVVYESTAIAPVEGSPGLREYTQTRPRLHQSGMRRRAKLLREFAACPPKSVRRFRGVCVFYLGDFHAAARCG